MTIDHDGSQGLGERANPEWGNINVVGGGLAGCEVALQLAARKIPCRLIEMKPSKRSPAHQLDGLAELVCSNSLRSQEVTRAPGLLKEEMRRTGGALIELAVAAQVPAGAAMAVDRSLFSSLVTQKIETSPFIQRVEAEVSEISGEGFTVIASGPLTSEPLAAAISELIGCEQLYFYDAIAPIVEADSVDMASVFAASRYGKGEGDDYLNCPLDEETYRAFVEALRTAEVVPLKECEDPGFFEGCLPVEVMASRGLDVLRYGPMKPVGLVEPSSGREPCAVIQLRHENREGTAYNMVGFQTRLRQPEQTRIFRMIPGLEGARFLRLGSMHRNTFIDGPRCLSSDGSLKARPEVFFAGQITGVEGYVESMASGLLVGMALAARLRGERWDPPPAETALGALGRHVAGSLLRSSQAAYQPTNINFGMFPSLAGRVGRKQRPAKYSDRALQALEAWCKRRRDGNQDTD